MVEEYNGFYHDMYVRYFDGLRNVRIVPQEMHDEKDEREKVHYPLAKEIAIGELSKYDGFESYTKKMFLF